MLLFHAKDGQTGSGKTYTMMGSEGDDRGLIPRICEDMFARMQEGKDEGGTTYRTEVSYLEIYNERVKDLLRKAGGAKKQQAASDSTATGHNLRVREHPTAGPYVQGLSKHLVVDVDDILGLMEQVRETI